jgi:hypothetical protein
MIYNNIKADTRVADDLVHEVHQLAVVDAAIVVVDDSLVPAPPPTRVTRGGRRRGR